MKKYLLIIILLLADIAPMQAVLKERDLPQTLSILRAELESYEKELTHRNMLMQKRQQEMSKFILKRMEDIDQITLMLYSQKSDYIFDLAYACHEATDSYDKFNDRTNPFVKYRGKIVGMIQQYRGLVMSLQRIPPFVFKNSPQAVKDREACITHATHILQLLTSSLANLKESQQRQSMMGQKLKEINDYAVKRYSEIQKNVFINGDDTYFTILSRFPRYWQEASQSLNEKYSPSSRTHSEWRGPVVVFLFISVLFYLIVSSLVCYVVVRWLLRRHFESEAARKKRPYIILSASMITFAIVLMLLRYFFIEHNFFLMASQLLVQYAWLVGTILISLLVRFDAKQINSGFRIYVPIIFIGFVVIVFRIIFIPNEVVNLVFPPLLLLSTIWQWSVILRHNKNIPHSDIFYTWISLAVMTVSVIVAWDGFTLLGVQILIWWIMLLTAIQTITCIYHLLSIYEKKKFSKAKDISRTWFYDFIRQALVPIIAVYALMISIYWAASVFELTEWCNTIFNYNFIDIKGIAQVSFQKLSATLALFFLVKYVVYVGKAFFYKIHKMRYGEKKHVSALGLNIATIVIWTFYALVAMIILNISRSGLVVAIGGMSTGIGFAMKDTLENLFYGISLMTGRLHIGDVIECDGIRGKVTDINYQSTLVEPVDGSIIAFLNSQLFQKNFKNLTRNHGYEMVTIPVGVAYGTNVEKARDLILERLEKLDCYYKATKPSILFSNFGDNSVDLMLSIWVPVATKVPSVATIKENIYNVFNDNNISMPFPQRDVYLHQVDEVPAEKETDKK
jgi:potassium-dependent mechanosensitive channel